MSIYKQNAISRKYLSQAQLAVTPSLRAIYPQIHPQSAQNLPPINASYPPGNLPPISDTGTPRIPVTKIPHPLYTLTHFSPNNDIKEL